MFTPLRKALPKFFLYTSFAFFSVACEGQPGDPAAGERTEVAVSVADSSFAVLVERLSERGGYFDTDNLISNETSYLHANGRLREAGVRGGAYIGVGPDQNFSYIAEIRPSIAYIIDIRRDNLLQHLLFKALFSLAGNRVEYLALLVGRRVPEDLDAWDVRDIEQLVAYIDSQPVNANALEALHRRVEQEVDSYGVPLSRSDHETIRRFHSIFISNGLSLRFTSHGRAPLPEYPTYRRLLVETDLDGRQASYLADEEDYQFVKSLQERNLIIPVVGDLAGPHAMRAIAGHARELGLNISAFYTSNVEFYLFDGHSFDAFARNSVNLPRDEKSVIIRSYFSRRVRHPEAVPGYVSTQLVQALDDFAADQANGGYRSYYDLVLRQVLSPR